MTMTQDVSKWCGVSVPFSRASGIRLTLACLASILANRNNESCFSMSAPLVAAVTAATTVVTKFFRLGEVLRGVVEILMDIWCRSLSCPKPRGEQDTDVDFSKFSKPKDISKKEEFNIAQ